MEIQRLTERLTEIRFRLKNQFSFFPRDCCQYASQVVEKELGLESTFGFFVKGGNGYNHHWNKTLEGQFVDLTADQFDPALPPVFITEQNSRTAEELYIEGAYLMI